MTDVPGAQGRATAKATRDLRRRRHWVFDLDGTLTVAMHDFASIRRELACPPGTPILEWLAQLPDLERAQKAAQLDALEAALCDGARPAHGAAALVTALTQAGCQLGILTRNNRDNALRTLHAIDLTLPFAPEWVLGRDEAPSKPDPTGLTRLAQAWGVASDTLVMVGDFHFDLEAGRAAGAFTVHVPHNDARWPEHTDLCVPSLAALHADLFER